jgi:hypothetical protein
MFNEYEDSDSEISLASASVSDEDNEYPIKELIADKWCPTRQEQVYLVHWEGYEIERATWEPAESFEGDKIEIVHDYVQRKKHGMVPDFDYKKWDRDREREQEEREERQRKREERKERKAKKMALESKQQSKKGRQRREKLVNDSIRHSRRPSPELAGFIVSDDSGLDEEEPDKLPSMDEDSDEDIPVRKRNLRKTTKKKAPMLLIPITSDESGSDRGGSSSNDSLMAALSLAEKQKRGNKGKVKVEERRPIKRPLQRAVPKKRPLGKSPSGSPPRVRKRPTIASSSTTKPPTTGITASSRPTQNDFFPSLSIQNAVRKKSNTERAPPAEELNLINLGGGGASVRPMDTEKRPQDLDAHATRNTPSTQQAQKRKRSPPFTNEFRSSRHPGPGPRLPTQANSGPRTQSKPERSKQLGVIIRDQPPPRKRQMGELGMDALKNIYDAGHLPDPVPQTPHAQAPPVQRPLSPVRPSARAQPPPPQPTPHSHSFQSALPFQAATSFQQGFPFQSAAEFRITPPLQDMDMEPHHADTYECEVEYGPSLSTMESMGKVKFVGFSSEFLAMLHSIQLEKLWISKSLEISYISKHFVPVSKHYCQFYSQTCCCYGLHALVSCSDSSVSHSYLVSSLWARQREAGDETIHALD